MDVYLEVAKYNFLKHAAYPWNVAASMVRKLIYLGGTMLFWYYISKFSDKAFDFRFLVSYFLISGAINSTLCNHNRFGRKIQKEIKSGKLNNRLIKPTDTILFLFSEFTGSFTVLNIYAVITFVIGVALTPPESFLSIPLFIIFAFLSAIMNFSINRIIGAIAFYTTEGGNIRNAYTHIYKVLSGEFIPLVYFPELLQKILVLTPLPHLLFTPTFVLISKGTPLDIPKYFIVALIWAIILHYGSMSFWNRSLKNYEGIGI